MGSDRTTICGISDLLLLAKVKDPAFNLSAFVRKALEYYIFEEEIPDPRREAARRAAETILIDKKKQQKLIEESESYEEKARELVETRNRVFNKEAKTFFRNPVVFENKLPELDTYGDFLQTWSDIADTLTTRCGFLVTPQECMSYIRIQIAEEL
jgi:hypothetical protein